MTKLLFYNVKIITNPLRLNFFSKINSPAFHTHSYRKTLFFSLHKKIRVTFWKNSFIFAGSLQNVGWSQCWIWILHVACFYLSSLFFHSLRWFPTFSLSRTHLEKFHWMKQWNFSRCAYQCPDFYLTLIIHFSCMIHFFFAFLYYSQASFCDHFLLMTTFFKIAVILKQGMN